MTHHPSCPMSRGGKTCIGCGGKGPSINNPLKKDNTKKVTPKTTKKSQ